MIKKYRLFNGQIMEFKNKEEFSDIVNYEFELMRKERQRKEMEMKKLKEKIKVYIVNVLQIKYSSYEIGLVNTKFEEDIEHNKAFMIWIDKGYTISHKLIHLNDIEL